MPVARRTQIRRATGIPSANDFLSMGRAASLSLHEILSVHFLAEHHRRDQQRCHYQQSTADNQ